MVRPHVPWIADLATHGSRPAVVTGAATLTYRDLAERVADTASLLAPRGPRRLVLVGAANRLDGLLACLGTMAAGHVALIGDGRDPAALARLASQYDPDVVVRPGADEQGRPHIEVRRDGSTHALHPELAVLLGTSGSTGSPKLVRLSATNIDANARSISQSLGIDSSDRAATSLPMPYAYGLSVVTSHLASGASLLLLQGSVADRCFWDAFREAGATSFAGVPYTFEILERTGFADLRLPTLRTVTQAGGRLAPERVRRFAALGRERGWRFVVMYGQTEATARMAVLPPELAELHPGTVGRAIPGGTFRVDPVPDAPAGAGELVYRGPNVMLGYAQQPADLARGREVTELRTGDLARVTPDGLVELVGRRHAFLKVAGLRIDLAQVEQRLESAGFTACAAGDDENLVVAVEHAPGPLPDPIRRLALDATGLPASAVRLVGVAELPRRPNGKPDRAAVAALTGSAAGAAAPLPPAGGVRALYADLLDCDVQSDDSFAALGGDSLSYVQVSLGLEALLGRLPRGWPSMPVHALQSIADARDPAPGRHRGRLRTPELRTVETGVALRALAILLVVGTHIHVFHLLGGAHVLLAVAGWNFARFGLADVSRTARLRSQVRSIARIVVPTVAWIAVALVISDDYATWNLFLLNPIVGPPPFTSTWHFWFIELLVYILVTAAAVLAIPAVDRFERRRPFALALVVLGIGLAFRAGLDLGILQSRPVLWLFALGWAGARASTWRQRAVLVAVAAVASPGFYFDPARELVIFAGVTSLLVVPSVRLPARITPAVGVLASASLSIYLVHWQVYPHLAGFSPLLAYGASIAAGVAAWQGATHATGRLARLRPALRAGILRTRPAQAKAA